MATADPMTSCMSLPMIAISTMIQRVILGTVEYSLLHTSARLRPENQKVEKEKIKKFLQHNLDTNMSVHG